MKTSTSAVIVALCTLAATAIGCQTGPAPTGPSPAGTLAAEVKFKGDSQMVTIAPDSADAEKKLPQIKTRGGGILHRRRQPVKVEVPQTCQGMAQCLDDGSLLHCPDGEWVQKECACGCLYHNNKAVCRSEQCKPGSTRTILDKINNSQTTEICENDGCGYSQQ